MLRETVSSSEASLRLHVADAVSSEARERAHDVSSVAAKASDRHSEVEALYDRLVDTCEAAEHRVGELQRLVEETNASVGRRFQQAEHSLQEQRVALSETRESLGSDVAGNDRAVNAAGNGMPADGVAGKDAAGNDAAGNDMAGSDVGSDTAGNDIGRGEDASERGSNGKSSMRATREPHQARFQDHPRRPRNELVVVIEGFVHDAELRAFVAERFGRWATTKVESARPKPPMRRKHGIIVFQHADDCDRARDAFGRRWFQAKNGAFWLQ